MTHEKTQDHFTNGTAKAAEAGAEHARAVRDAAQARLDEAQATLDRAVHDGRREAEYVAERSGQAVRENPLLTVAGAMGVGLLMGLALRKKS